MTHLSRAADYAIRAMAYLAEKNRTSIILISEISKQEDIPEVFLRKIIQSLSRSGLIITYRGVKGGVSLARPANQIHLLEIIESAQGKISISNCVLHGESCERTRGCPVHHIWVETQQKFVELLHSRTLDEVAVKGRPLPV